MKKYTLVLIFNLLFVVSSAQIDSELIKKKVTENPEENFYPLLEKFRVDPSALTREQLNQLYYGSKFVKNDYSLGDYNKDYDAIWKKAGKKLSAEKAQ